MTPQENQLLRAFLTQLMQAQLTVRDPEVETLINRAIAQQPDAAYLLVQRALLLERALGQARAQIANLQAQGGSSFLGDDGRGSPDSRGPFGAAPSAAPMPSPLPPPPAAPGASSWGSRLGSAAATAAGVAGGAFLFEGLEGLFGHHGGNGSGFFGGSGSSLEPIENVTINNFDSDPALRDPAPGNDLLSDQGSLDEVDLDDDTSWT